MILRGTREKERIVRVDDQRLDTDGISESNCFITREQQTEEKEKDVMPHCREYLSRTEGCTAATAVFWGQNDERAYANGIGPDYLDSITRT